MIDEQIAELDRALESHGQCICDSCARLHARTIVGLRQSLADHEAFPLRARRIASNPIPRIGLEEQPNTSDPVVGFHRWYYNKGVWRKVSFMGVYCAKNVLDLWNYQEIIWELRPGLIVEFGTYAGGTAMYLAWVMDLVHQFGEGSPTRNVLTVDLDHGPLNADARMYVDCLNASSTSELAWKTIMNRRVLGAPSMYILDSDHSKANVLAELEMLRGLTRPGDYVIIEDTNINGHPVLPDFGPGPWEALEEYERQHPDDYEHDTARETKFGMTFNPQGYLRRR